MLASSPGDPIWLREGTFLIKKLSNDNGIPVGSFLSKPCRGIFLDRKCYMSKTYICAYVDDLGERLIEEDEVLELKPKG